MRDARSPIDGILSPFGVLMGSVAFSPLTLFAMSEPGVWYDPLDLTTLFQDAAGTAPMTAAAQHDGLTLDKSRGAVGTNGAFRRNLLPWTENYSNAAWLKSAATATAEVLTESSGAGPHVLYVVQSFTAADYTFAVDFKPNGRDWVVLQARSNFSYFGMTGAGSLGNISGTVTSRSITLLPDGYYRCVITVPATAGSDNVTIYLASSNGNVSYTGNGTSGVFIRNAQLELGSTDTAYQRITSDWTSTMAGIHAAQASSTFKPAYQTTPQRLQFDGSDDRLPFTYNPTASGSLAVRINGTTASRVVMGSQAATDGRVFIALAADGSLGAGIGAQSTSTIKGATDIRSVWTTGVVTWDGTTVRLYQNGVEVYSGAQSGAVNTTVPMRVGCLNSNGTDGAFWAGGIGAAIALGRVMTPAEISSLHTLWSTIQ